VQSHTCPFTHDRVATAEPGLHSIVPQRGSAATWDIRGRRRRQARLNLPDRWRGRALLGRRNPMSASDGEGLCGTRSKPDDIALKIRMVKGSRLLASRASPRRVVTRNPMQRIRGTTGIRSDLHERRARRRSGMIDLLHATHGWRRSTLHRCASSAPGSPYQLDRRTCRTGWFSLYSPAASCWREIGRRHAPSSAHKRRTPSAGCSSS